MRENNVVIYSGGMDSFTLLNHVRHRQGDVFAISMDYGQRHKRELGCARRVCALYGIHHQVLDLTTLGDVFNGSALTGGGQVPHGHYAEETMKATVVPNRNMVLLALSVAYAERLDAKHVYYGAHAGDHDIYPDCRPGFVAAMNRASMLGTYNEITINAPFLEMDKGGILKHGRDDLGLKAVDYIQTWTCYEGGTRACGKCGACVERLEAFEKVGWADPLPYKEE